MLSFIYFISIINLSLTQLCRNLIQSSKSQIELSNKFKHNLPQLIREESSHQLNSNCISLLLTTANFNVLDYYISELNKNGIAYRERLNTAINHIESKLTYLHNKFRFEEKDYQSVIPASQWAQSLDNIYIEVKFAHRHDSPGCLEMSNLNITIGNNTLYVRAYCVLGEVPIKFEINFTTLERIDVNRSSYGSGSVGRYQITLKKKIRKYWSRLLLDKNGTVPNMRVWYEMKEKFEKEIQRYEERQEEEEFRREYEMMRSKEREKMRKRREREKRKVERNLTNSDNSMNKTTIEGKKKRKKKKKQNKKTDL